MTTGTFTTSSLGDSSECTFSVITSDCSERQTYYRSADMDHRTNDENSRERSTDSRGLTENGFEETSGYRLRQKRWSNYSMSSDSSAKSLDEIQTDFQNTNILGHVTNNMHGFIFNNDDYNVCM